MAAQEDFDPTKDSTAANALRLASHVLQKGLQAGGLVGLVIVAPIVAYRNRGSGLPLLPKLVKAQAISAAVGLGFGGASGLGRMLTVDGDLKEGLEDRVYRLHYNKSQNRTDLFAQVGMALGGTAAAVALGPTPLTVFSGASVGAALGVLSHMRTWDYAGEKAGEEVAKAAAKEA